MRDCDRSRPPRRGKTHRTPRTRERSRTARRRLRALPLHYAETANAELGSHPPLPGHVVCAAASNRCQLYRYLIPDPAFFPVRAPVRLIKLMPGFFNFFSTFFSVLCVPGDVFH